MVCCFCLNGEGVQKIIPGPPLAGGRPVDNDLTLPCPTLPGVQYRLCPKRRFALKSVSVQ